MKKPPLALIIATVLYLGYLAILLILNLSPIVAGRLVFSIVLFFFVLRGNRIAGNILATLCSLSSLILLIAAIATISNNTMGGVLFTIIAGLLALFASYLFFSSEIRAFQTKELPISSS